MSTTDALAERIVISTEGTTARALTPASERGRTVERIISLVSPLLLLVVWEALVRSGTLDLRFFPPPTDVFRAAWRLIASGDMIEHLRASLTRAVIGFVIGAVPAVIIGMSMGLFRLVRAAVWPVVGALFPEMRHRQPSAATRVIGSSSRGTLGAADQQHGNTLTDSLELQLVATRARAMLWALQHVRTGNRHLPIEEVKPRCSAERWTARSPNTKGTK